MPNGGKIKTSIPCSMAQENTKSILSITSAFSDIRTYWSCPSVAGFLGKATQITSSCTASSNHAAPSSTGLRTMLTSDVYIAAPELSASIGSQCTWRGASSKAARYVVRRYRPAARESRKAGRSPALSPLAVNLTTATRCGKPLCSAARLLQISIGPIVAGATCMLAGTAYLGSSNNDMSTTSGMSCDIGVRTPAFTLASEPPKPGTQCEPRLQA
mmetsp:Transcript_21640/g.39688  ORF Transcript_21640/g.39688 Transcript_21640/m.39688 type:complete len:215 (-) Transcript_21640:114-758(-)